MSHYDYKVSQELAADDVPFYALVMAAMRRADTNNAERLQQAFPRVWAELQGRYNRPGGYLEGEEVGGS